MGCRVKGTLFTHGSLDFFVRWVSPFGHPPMLSNGSSFYYLQLALHINVLADV